MPIRWTRRRVLQVALSGWGASLAGCALLSGNESDVVVTNSAQVAVTAEVTVTRMPDDEVVIQEEVEIPPDNTVYYPNVLGEDGAYRINVVVRKGPSGVFTASPTDRPVEVVITSTNVDFYPGSKTPDA